MREWWTVTCDDLPAEDVLAASAEMAAIGWAEGRGHEADDHPVVTVARRGELPRRFRLSARVVWSAREA